jgi:ATP-dependent Clp protease ATP-binding subunit ClpX
MPGDLLKFGLIPEFVGRLPIVVTLEALDRNALISILTEPKNALIKQYKKLFEMDNVELEFSKEALLSIADEAIKRNTGARGLRAIIEDIIRDIMFDVPSNEGIAKVIVNEDTIKSKQPELVMAEGEKRTPIKVSKKGRGKKGIETA